MKTKKGTENMTIAEYMEYEARTKRQNIHPTRCEDADFNCLRNKSVAMEYPYYSENAKIDLYYDFGEDMGGIKECESDMEEQELEGQTDETVNEWFKTEIKKYRRMQQKKNQECAETRA
ncbi:hypothetical protein Tco_0341580 [Tanacetum coccineum]